MSSCKKSGVEETRQLGTGSWGRELILAEVALHQYVMWAFQPPQFPHLYGDGDTHHSSCLGMEKLHFVFSLLLCAVGSECI